jgi:diguanylate cyclase (GGDEF)-like protein/PAS domain S-box-containing protein
MASDRQAALHAARRQIDFPSALIASIQDGFALLAPDGRILEANERLAVIARSSPDDLVATGELSQLWSSDDLTGMERVLSGTTPQEITVTLRRADGECFPASVACAPVRDRGGVTLAHAVTIRDLTRRRRAEEASRTAAELHEALAAEQAALRRVATAVAEDHSPERVFALVAEEASRVLGADSGAVVRFDESEHGVVVGSWANADKLRRQEGTRLPLAGGSATAQVSATGRPSRVEDYGTLDAETRAALGQMPFRCGLAAPIRAGADLWGALTVQSRHRDALPPLSEERLADFAELVGMAIANADVFAQMARQAETDPLTDLPNRRKLEQSMEEAVETAKAEDRTLSVLVLDLDDFKRVNDVHGHDAGDAVLRAVARSLEAALRPCDLAGRLGGEEFLVLLPDTGTRGAALVAERLRVAVSHITGVERAPMTASFGVATYPSHADSAGELFRAADAAMYQAKKLGRNRTVVFNPAAARTGAEAAATAQADLQGYLRSVLALAAALDERDTYTHEHSRTVAGYAAAIGARLGLDGDQLEDLRIAGLLHDIGKVGVADSILRKPGPLDDTEWAEMRRHPEIGARLLAHPGLAHVRDWVLRHHERPDGRGYPAGADSNEVPLEARILAVADAYEAMTSDRPYRQALPRARAFAELEAGRDTQFDGRVVDAFLAHLATEDALATSAPPQSPVPETAASEGRSGR